MKCPTCGREKPKTHAQREHFHKLCTLIGREIGETPRHVKEAIKRDFFGLDEYKIGSKWYKSVRSSESAGREEYSQLVDYTYQWAAENLGIVLINPNEPPMEAK